MPITFRIAYISPNGSTRKVAEAIADEVLQGGSTAALTDLSNVDQTRSLNRALRSDEETFLFIGSPVYVNLAVAPIMAFIDDLPPSPGRWAVPFATYGIACSGIALWQMANALQEKGFRIAAAAKIAALHSMMWKADHPEGEGQPNQGDLSHVQVMAETLLSRLPNGTLAPIELSTLDYQPPDLAAKFKAQLIQPWRGISRTVDTDVCDECGECAQSCPVDAITLNPKPIFGDSCFNCCNCIRLCPKEAIVPTSPLPAVEEMIRERVRTINEQPLSQLFLADPEGVGKVPGTHS